MSKIKSPVCKLYDFKVFDEVVEEDDESGFNDNKKFKIQMFGMDEEGMEYSIWVENFKPFFYIKVPDNWGKKEKAKVQDGLMELLKKEELRRKWKNKDRNPKTYPKPKINESLENYILRNIKTYTSYYEDSIVELKIMKRRKLYGFDNFKYYKFIVIKFKNTTMYNKIKNLWYTDEPDFRKRKLKKGGLKINGGKLELYEAKLDPLLRYFHVYDISPSGWVKLNKALLSRLEKTTCDYEYSVDAKNVMAIPDKEDSVPLKIMSFDIEASSSHGDFPLAKKSYKKMVGEMIQYWKINKKKIKGLDMEKKKILFKKLVLTAFGYENEEGISRVFLKRKKNFPTRNELDTKLEQLLKQSVGNQWKGLLKKKRDELDILIEDNMDEEDLKLEYEKWCPMFPKDCYDKNLVYLLDRAETKVPFKFDAGDKLAVMDRAISPNEKKHYPHHPEYYLPYLEGDKVTFIGSTFINFGEKEPYLNHIIALKDCDKMNNVENAEIECYKKERNVLKAWTNTVQRENPNIIIGYNIFGFDWKFMIERADELGCIEDFLKLSKNKNESCKVKHTVTKVASGTHEQIYAKIPGRVQLDLYNYFRKTVNLDSYKLDNVSSHFISDYIKNIEYDEENKKTIIKSGNLMGIKNGHYVKFELIGHSVDLYENGKKFIVSDLDLKNKYFKVEGKLDFKNLKAKWCLAKDDVGPQDIFRLTNEGSKERAIVAKYCIQDCNLVHNLMIKNDILTETNEIASICSVPIDYIIMRGQGIKLLSFIAKSCREYDTLMPVLDKSEEKDGYEGAICLVPKCAFYPDNPIAVNDYSSLYPSSMISENISHDSKVWTKEYNLNGELIKTTGVKDISGNYIYDNLPGYKYVDIEYDTYMYIRKTKQSAEVKTKCGTKICRYVQFKNNEKAIMPSVLQKLLASRKATRKLIKYKTVKDKNGNEVSGLLKKDDEYHEITNKEGITKIKNDDVVSINDTYDDFMKNVLDKRQLGYKVTANSLYGQCGAKTSAFYDKDIAASTTATGRKLLMYAKRVVEDCYGDTVVDTKYGKMKTRAEYIYGDTDSVFFTFNLEDMEGNKVKGKKALEVTIDLAVEVEKIATKFLKSPHTLEYEKTFMPFLLLSKKRYVGILHEFDINKGKRKSMGIVLKRRDNAPCVKDAYGGIVDILMKEKDVKKAINFLKGYLGDMIKEKIPLDKLIISKSLRDFYKNPESIAHKVLADRMGKRDPGNKPSVGSRVPFVFIQTKGNVKLQGDKIEHPSYVIKHNLKPDYIYYITNQLMKPIQQIFALVLDQIPEFKIYSRAFKRRTNSIRRMFKDDEKKMSDKIEKEANKHVKKLIFEEFLRQAKNTKNGQKTLDSFFN